MASALGVLKWTEDQFWRATFHGYTAAMKGHLVSSGVDLTPPPSKQEINEAFRAFEKQEKAAMGGHQT